MKNHQTEYLKISITPTGDAFVEASLLMGGTPVEYIRFGMVVPRGLDIVAGDIWLAAAEKFREAATDVGRIQE